MPSLVVRASFARPACVHPYTLQVLETLKDPLQTLVQGREPEVVWGVLSNFLVLAQRYPLIFSQVGCLPFTSPYCNLCTRARACLCACVRV